jgi:hypothetical protein
MAKINMTGQTQSIVQLDPGKYVSEIVGWEFGFSSNGNEMLTIVHECCKSKSGGGPKGRIYDRLVFTASAAWKIEQFIECFAASAGMNVKIGDDVEIDEAVMARMFLNAKGGVVVSNEEYDGKPRNRIESFIPSKDCGVFPKGDTPRVLTRSQRDAAPAPASIPSMVSAPSEFDDDDDIPF